MQLKKVYLFASIASQYGVTNHFTGELANALNRHGVVSRVIEAKRDDPRSFLQAILDDPPDCTLSFNGLLPDAEGHFLCDLIKIPHVACLVDAPIHFFPLIKSPLNIITCIDRYFCQIFRDSHFPQVIFLPHAISKAEAPLLDGHPQYDVLMLHSFIDYEKIQRKWAKTYSPALAKVLEEAAELTLTDNNLPYMQAFAQTLDHHLRAGQSIDPHLLDYETLLAELEAYICGKSRIDLLKNIQDVSVHVFGSQDGNVGWKKYLGNQSNIKIHPPVSFTDALELMKKAKILLDCTPKIKQGTHERILNGLACGAAVLTLENSYMREHFRDEEDILFYQFQKWDEVNHKIQTYLNDEERRYRLVGKGRKKVMDHHTWDQRAHTLIHELSPFLEAIKKNR